MKREYFLGRPTSDGFLAHINDEINSGNYFTYILKGGPGTGKSSLMRHIANSYDEVEVYYCSSDPDSYDAIILPKENIIIVDGTAPHIIEPRYIGVKQKIINLGDYLDDEMLKRNTEQIIYLTDKCNILHKTAKRYIKAAQSLYQNIVSASENAVIIENVDNYCNQHIKGVPRKVDGEKGRISFKQITSTTPQGIKTNETPFSGYRVFLIDDKHYAAVDRILKKLSSSYSELGYSVVISENPLFDSCVYEHMIVPELMIAYTSNHSINCDETTAENELYDENKLSDKASRIKFDKYAATAILSEAIHTLTQAKNTHDELESYYIRAMNFDKLKRLTKKISNTIGKD